MRPRKQMLSVIVFIRGVDLNTTACITIIIGGDNFNWIVSALPRLAIQLATEIN
ncbi:hypothetical protein SPHINGO8BC_90044 [Sphingobacterium multivorum]|uniref:Uncharacterized protein n=1 Tax=Sphingobacterium multivorum TaxID=28454 RepID=A0A654DQ86_SPHMU|nr:hypothetical protein SPHINGO8BC_90044 [Sphingobacterium multivorum]